MIEDQIAELNRNLDAFERCVTSLDEGAFLKSLRRWTPRDIVAHLVGWNRYVIEGSRQILKGELPFYDVDPGEDFANVNAELIRKYPSQDRDELLEELESSERELTAFLRSLDESAWDGDFGVENKGATITVRNTVDDLIADYAHHQEQLAALADSKESSLNCMEKRISPLKNRPAADPRRDEKSSKF